MKGDSLAVKAYNEIRKKILSQQVSADARLKEDEWAGKLEVSRIAIREALNRLLGEGLVVSGLKGGYFVKSMTHKDFHAIREFRLILEVGALKLAIAKITPGQIKELEIICDDFTLMSRQGYLSGAREADMKFHETLIKIAQNEQLSSVYIASHIPLFHANLHNAMGELDDYAKTDADHRQLLKAIKKRDLALAESTLTAHFQRSF
jgi:DNA-binding GntR family transcriptional regulator